jgi:hypothetical protein
MAGAATTGPWVDEGSVLVYRLFDVADAVDLARAEALVSAPASRLVLTRAGSATALEFPRPPLRLELGPRRAPLPAGPREVQASAHVYDFGVVSVRYRLPIQAGTSLGALLPLGEALVARATRALDAAARADARAVAAALGPALERPHEWEGLETYQVFFLERLSGAPARAAALLGEAPVAELLLGEPAPAPLSSGERQDIAAHLWSYLEGDLAVVHWNAALVVEPTGAEDVPDLLEFATAHLLELRYYDALLDRELHAIYDEIEAGGHLVRHILTRRYLALRRRTAALLLELSEMTERLDNAVKIVGDLHLARLYRGAVRRFRLGSWEEGVLRKQRLLAEVNDLIGDAADTSRAELLELAIILLIMAEIAAALL